MPSNQHEQELRKHGAQHKTWQLLLYWAAQAQHAGAGVGLLHLYEIGIGVWLVILHTGQTSFLLQF